MPNRANALQSFEWYLKVCFAHWLLTVFLDIKFEYLGNFMIELE